MIEDNHAVRYTGESKDLVEEEHLKNRSVLVSRGVVEL
jgi:hypothetical protein